MRDSAKLARHKAQRHRAMSVRGFFASAMPFMVGIGIPVGVLIGGAALPIAYDLKGAVGRVEATISDLEKSDRTELDRINAKLDEQRKLVELLAGRMHDTETDPMALLMRQGVTVDYAMAEAFVNGVAVVFPKNKEAEQRLIVFGYRKQELTPVISGYVAATVPATWGVKFFTPEPDQPAGQH
jgi:hypothetical protein